MSDQSPSDRGMLQEDLVRAFLARRDEPCPGCGYSLRGLTTDMCPECGHTVRLCVVRPHRDMPRLAVWSALGSLAANIVWCVYGLVQFMSLTAPAGALPANLYLRVYLYTGIQTLLSIFAIAIPAVLWKLRGPETGARWLVSLALVYWFIKVNLQLFQWF